MISTSTYDYACLLLKLSSNHPEKPEPIGALGIRENYQTIQRRIQMILNPYQKASILTPFLMTLSLSLILGLALFSQGEESTDNQAEKAVSAANAWTEIIDQGNYPESYEKSSASFKKAVTFEKWVAALNSVRTPLGKLLSRKVVSKLIQNDIPAGSKTIKGTFCIILAESSYQNLKSALETITFELESDGQWRASGYYSNPN